MIFKDRIDAGEKLAKALEKFKSSKDAIVLGLPRGGMVVADVVVRKLNLPLDLIVSRKIGAPGNPEFAVGAITEDGEIVLNKEVVEDHKVDDDYIERTANEEKKEAERILKTYRGDRVKLDLSGKTVIMVDDGIATGLTMEAAIKSVKKKGAKKVVVAVPCSAESSLRRIENIVDEVVCLYVPPFFGAVGAFYEVFGQPSDDEVVEIMSY